MKKKIIVTLLSALTVASIGTGCGQSNAASEALAVKSSDAYYDTYEAGATAEEYYADDIYEEEAAYEDVYYDEAPAEEYLANSEISARSLSDIGEVTSEQEQKSSGLEYEDKLVYEANLTIETLDFDKTYAELKALIEENGGRIESESYDAHFGSYTTYNTQRKGYQTTKQDYMVIRIPSKNYQKFIESDDELGNVTGKTQSLTNITQNYYSTKTRIELLEGQLEYYKYQLALIEEKLMDCEDYEYVIGQMVELEDRIIDVQNQINQCSSSVQTMDMQVSYSTVYLDLIEVKEYSDITNVAEEEDSFATRMKETILNSIETFLNVMEFLLTVFIFVLPYILTVGLFGGIIFVIASGANKLNKKKIVKKNLQKDNSKDEVK